MYNFPSKLVTPLIVNVHVHMHVSNTLESTLHSYKAILALIMQEEFFFHFIHLKDKLRYLHFFFVPGLTGRDGSSWEKRQKLTTFMTSTAKCDNFNQRSIELLAQMSQCNSVLCVRVVLWTRKAACKWITDSFVHAVHFQWRQWYLWQYSDVKYKGGLQRCGFPIRG